MRLLPYGDRAVLVELPDAGAVLTAHRVLTGLRADWIEAVVPAARTVLVEFAATRPLPARAESLHTLPGPGGLPAPIESLRALIESLQEALDGSAAADPTEPATVLQLPVRYDGADLAAVAEELGSNISDVVQLHSEPEYTVQFCGFSPGFGYLTGLDRQLRLPRLASPRASVPAGSVAVAGEFTGVYPRSSPGGWRLLGRTDAPLFDLARTPPALLVPGTRVRFLPR